MVQLPCKLMLMILLRHTLKSMHLTLNQWQYKMLHKLVHLLWKRRLVVDLLMAEDPYPVPLLLARTALAPPRGRRNRS